MPIIRHDEFVKAIERFLDRHGIKRRRYERRSKHRAVVVSHDGRDVVVFFPCSGSDWRGPRNAVATLRHVLGLVGR